MAMAGVSRAEAERIAAPLAAGADRAEEPAEIMAELKPVITLIVAAQRHVRTAPVGMGGAVVIGFDLGMIDQLARWKGIEMTPERADDVMVLEGEMVRLLNARAAA